MKRDGLGPLRLILLVLGILFVVCGLAAILTQSQLKHVMGIFMGMEQSNAMWPESALFDYVFRLSCVGYLWIGLTLLIACKNPDKYGVFIDVAIVGLILFGIVSATVGIKNEIPAAAFILDSGASVAGAILLIMFRSK